MIFIFTFIHIFISISFPSLLSSHCYFLFICNSFWLCILHFSSILISTLSLLSSFCSFNINFYLNPNPDFHFDLTFISTPDTILIDISSLFLFYPYLIAIVLPFLLFYFYFIVILILSLFYFYSSFYFFILIDIFIFTSIFTFLCNSILLLF